MPFGGRSKAAQAVTPPPPNPAETDKSRMTEADKAAEELRKRARRAGSGGRQSTILTTPLGVVDTAPVVRKSLLGQ